MNSAVNSFDPPPSEGGAATHRASHTRAACRWARWRRSARRLPALAHPPRPTPQASRRSASPSGCCASSAGCTTS